MSRTYYGVYAYRSTFSSDRLFITREEALAFDRNFAATRASQLTAAEIENALARGDREIKELLAFLAEEIPYAPAAEQSA